MRAMNSNLLSSFFLFQHSQEKLGSMSWLTNFTYVARHQSAELAMLAFDFGKIHFGVRESTHEIVFFI